MRRRQRREQRVRADGAGPGVEAERTPTRVAVRGMLQPELDDSRDLPRPREEAHSKTDAVIEGTSPAFPPQPPQQTSKTPVQAAEGAYRAALRGGPAAQIPRCSVTLALLH